VGRQPLEGNDGAEPPKRLRLQITSGPPVLVLFESGAVGDLGLYTCELRQPVFNYCEQGFNRSPRDNHDFSPF
jgi:hypothetical protein